MLFYVAFVFLLFALVWVYFLFKKQKKNIKRSISHLIKQNKQIEKYGCPFKYIPQ